MFKTGSPARWIVLCLAFAVLAAVPAFTRFKTVTPPFDALSVSGFGAAADVVIADVNGDGRVDLIGAVPSLNGVRVALGDGAGGFGSAATYASGAGPTSVAVADMNGDGFMDLVVSNANIANPAAGTVAVLIGTGAGVFGGPSAISVPFPTALKTGDFNGDGAPDVVVLSQQGAIQILRNLNNSTGQVVPSFSGGVPGIGTRLDVGDFNQDGNLDVAVVVSHGSSPDDGFGKLALFTGTGLGNLNPIGTWSFPAGYNIDDVVVRNIDSDPAPEVIVHSFGFTGPGGGGVWVIDNNGAGVMANTPVRYTAPVGTSGLAVGDINSDGFADVMLTVSSTGAVSYYLNNGAGIFGAAVAGPTVGITGAAQYAAAADLDGTGTGSIDVVVARAGADPVVLLNVSNRPPLANAGTDQSVPATSAAGAAVSLSGAASTDPDADGLTYQWTDESNAVISGAATASVTAALGTHVYTLTVTDPGGLTSTDTVSITVFDSFSVSITSPAPGASFAFGQVVSPVFNCSDSAGLLVSCVGSPLTAGTLDTSSVGAMTLTVTATNSLGDSSSTSLGYTVLTAPLTVKLTAAGKFYDGSALEPDAAMSCALTGVQAGDSVTCTASNGTFGTSAVGASPVTATVTIGGPQASNYTLGVAGTSVMSQTIAAVAGGSGSLFAEAVYGQAGSFTSNGSGTSATTLNHPYRVSVDSTGGLYVAEENNHRVVYYPAGSTTATRVYGQGGSFTSADSNHGGLSANSLSSPRALKVDSHDNLYIVDSGNHRVLFFLNGSTTATRVYGQLGSFTTSGPNQGGGITANNVNDPNGVAIDADDLVYIADQSNNRVLTFAGGSTTATGVYGQTNFTSGGGGVGLTKFNTPSNLALDAAGNLYLSDEQNHRVLFFLKGSTTPTRVYGQNGSFTTNSASTSATGLNAPRVGGVDANNNLYVADRQNNRVLFFPSGSTTATRVYGQNGSFTTGSANNGGVTSSSFNTPIDVGIGPDGKIFVPDYQNNRVLRFATGGSGSISAIPLTVTLTAANKQYDQNSTEPNASMSCTVSGLLPQDAGNVVCAATNGSFNSQSVGATWTVTATVTISGPGAANYTVGPVGSATTSSTATTTASITAKSVTASISGVNKSYDGTRNASITCALSGLASGDTFTQCAASTTAANTQFDTAAVGVGKTITATGIILTSNQTNYTLTNPNQTTTGSILTKPLSATLTAAGKGYDGTATEPDANMTCTLTGVVAGDSVSCVPSGGQFASAAIGSGGVTATVTIGGPAVANYTLGSTGTSVLSLVSRVGPTVTTGAAAEFVFGQAGSFTANTPNTGGVSSASLRNPYRVAVDATGGVYVAEDQNNRVMFYPAGSATATRVYGQGGSFVATTANNGGVSANSLSSPRGVILDASGNLFVADTANNRVLMFAPGSTTATRVYGQSLFTTSTQNQPLGFQASATGLSGPNAIAVDATGVYVADTNNNRGLFYPGTSTTATRVYAQSNFGSNFGNSGASGIRNPEGIAVSANGTVYLSDTGNSRVIVYASGGTTATGVYGTNGNLTGFSFGNIIGLNANSLSGPRGLTVDANDNLYVADTQNNRVLFYPAGTTTATRVYGQTGFTTNGCNAGGPGASSLCLPSSAIASADGNLFVADTNNHRVLRYSLDGSGRIGSATVTAVLTAADKDVDGNTTEPDASMTCTVNGVAPVDAGNVTCAATNGSFSSAAPGAHTVTATVTISGSAASNYTFGAVGTSVTSATATTTATITQSVTTVSAVITAASKRYDGSANASVTCTLVGVTNGDPVGCTASASAADTQFSSTNAGTGLTVTANNIVLTNNTGNHYLLDSTTATAIADITPASSTTTVSCTLPAVFTGSALTPCTATVTGAGSLSQAVTVSYLNNTDAGTATANAAFDGDVNHASSSGTATFTITPAATTTTISCTPSVTYTGVALTPCTATTTDANTFSATATVTYLNNIDAGTATANATFDADANHASSSATATFTITPASTTTTIICTSPVAFTGSALTPCTATTTDGGTFSATVVVNYTNNVAAGTATATANFAGDANHALSDASATFAISAATTVTIVTCPASVTANGAAQTPCSATVTGAGGLNTTAAVTYANNVTPGTATAAATYSGDANHTSSTGSTTFTITAANAGVMDGNGRIPTIPALADRLLHFDFSAAQLAQGAGGGNLSFWTTTAKGKVLSDFTFDATAITSTLFSDNPAFTSGGAKAPVIDTVLVTGVGSWNGDDGYTFVARATDQGEPGTGKDTFTLTISDPFGAIVLDVAGTLTSGNIASSRLPGRNGRPLFLSSPSNQIVEATGPLGAIVTYATATAVDNQGVPVTVACDPVSGSQVPLGRTRGVCTATDARGLVKTTPFIIRVVDTTAPTFTTTPVSITVEADRQSGAAVAYATPVATDTVDTSVTVRCTPASGRAFDMGTTLVTCTATDNSGNTATTSFSVTVRDTTAPVFTSAAGNVVSEATSTLGDSVNFPTPRARDNADNNVGVTCSSASGSTFPIGVTTVTCTATDNSGNSATTSFTVTVRDTTAPKITISEPGGSYPLNAVVHVSYACTDSGSGVASCVGAIPNNGTINTTVPGTYTFTVTATDAAGNSATKSVNYTVKKK